MAEYYSTPGTQAVDIPKYYANWDEEFWVVAPTPDKTYEITLAYDKEPELLQIQLLHPLQHSWNLFVKQISRFTFIRLSGKYIWILERSTRYVTILSRSL